MRLTPIARGLWLAAGALLIGLALPFPVSAHTGAGGLSGFMSGVAHPLFGPDHLVAMLAVVEAEYRVMRRDVREKDRGFAATRLGRVVNFGRKKLFETA